MLPQSLELVATEKSAANAAPNDVEEGSPPSANSDKNSAFHLPEPQDSSEDETSVEEQSSSLKPDHQSNKAAKDAGTESESSLIYHTKDHEDDKTKRPSALPSLLDESLKQGASDGNDDDNKPLSTTTAEQSILAPPSRASLLLPMDIQQNVEAEGEGESPKKRRRHHPFHSSSTKAHVWDGFVRKGTRLKNLVEEAFEQMTHYKNDIDRVSNMDDGSSEMPTNRNKRARKAGIEESDDAASHPLTVLDHAAALAREKTAECMILQKKLQDAKTDVAALTATNDALRESSSSTSARLECAVEALKLTSSNAANARADADAAEATASSLASRLEALRSVVQDTQRTARTLAKEHEEIAKAERVVETKLVQKEAELARFQSKQRQVVKERNEQKAQAEQFQQDYKSLQLQLDQRQQELHKHAQQLGEYKALEQARHDRSVRMEQELHEARSMLSTASATAAETETTTAVLQETIRALQKENQSLHDRMASIQNGAMKEQERLNEALTKSEKQVQSLKIDAATHEQDKQRLVMDKREMEKKATQLKTRMATAERRLRDATSLVPLESPADEDAESGGELALPASTRKPRGVTFSIPPLQQQTTPRKRSTSEVAAKVTPALRRKSNTCCVCQQPASGFMKSCQCGQSNCDKRAHGHCLAKLQHNKIIGPSVSHPGTPATRAPVLLCGAIKIA